MNMSTRKLGVCCPHRKVDLRLHLVSLHPCRVSSEVNQGKGKVEANVDCSSKQQGDCSGERGGGYTQHQQQVKQGSKQRL